MYVAGHADQGPVELGEMVEQGAGRVAVQDEVGSDLVPVATDGDGAHASVEPCVSCCASGTDRSLSADPSTGTRIVSGTNASSRGPTEVDMTCSSLPADFRGQHAAGSGR